jgi:hypothetical protein
MPLTGAKGHEDPEMVVVGKENVRASLFVLLQYVPLQFSSSFSLPNFFFQKNTQQTGSTIH